MMVLVHVIKYVKGLIQLAKSLFLFLLFCRAGTSSGLQKAVGCLVQYARKQNGQPL